MVKLNVVLILFIGVFMVIYSFKKNSDIVDTKKDQSLKEKSLKEKEKIKKTLPNFKINIFNTTTSNLEKDNQPEKKTNWKKIKPCKKKFTNIIEYDKDLVFLYKNRNDDLVEVKDLKKKLNQKMIFDFDSINGLDLLNHIKVALDLEERIVLTREEEEIIKKFTFRFSPKPHPRLVGPMLALVLDSPKFSYFFRDNKIHIVRSEIENQKIARDSNCVNKK